MALGELAPAGLQGLRQYDQGIVMVMYDLLWRLGQEYQFPLIDRFENLVVIAIEPVQLLC